MNNSTICAISTPPGIGGIAVIRVSGADAFAICDSIFVPAHKDISVSLAESHKLLYGEIRENENLIDEVVVGVFRNPHSFTGEDVVEISCHASPYIQQQILKLLIDKGCRLAKPGEFTQRAFMNGKMDLAQAEAVADLIASDSAASPWP